MPYTIQGTTVKQRTGAFIVEMAINLPSPSTGAEEEFVQLRVMVSASDPHPRLSELQKVALQRVRAQLDVEIQNLQLPQGRTP